MVYISTLLDSDHGGHAMPDLKYFDADSLPEKAGVLLVGCSSQPPHQTTQTTYERVAILDSLNIRQTVKDNAAQWSSHCSGYLRYWGVLSDAPVERAQIRKELLQSHKPENK